MSEPDRERLYVARAKDSIRAVLDEQLAVVSAELEARISERSFIDEHDVAEVRNELHFHDLVRGSDRSIRVYDRIRNTMPGICTDVAAVWKQTCMAAGYAPLLEQLRAKSRLTARRELMTELRDVAITHGLRGGW